MKFCGKCQFTMLRLRYIIEADSLERRCQKGAFGMVDHYCDDCFYKGHVYGTGPAFCRYLLMTDRRRPCPAGKGCTVKVPREVKRRKKKTDENSRKT